MSDQYEYWYTCHTCGSHGIGDAPFYSCPACKSYNIDSNKTLSKESISYKRKGVLDEI